MTKKLDSIKIQRTIWAKLYFAGFLLVKILSAFLAVAFVIWAIVDEAKSYRDEPKLLKTKYSSKFKDYKLPTLYLTVKFLPNKHVNAYDVHVEALGEIFRLRKIDCLQSPDVIFHKTKGIGYRCWKLEYNVDNVKDPTDLVGTMSILLAYEFHSEQDKKDYFNILNAEQIINSFFPQVDIHFEYEGVDYQIGNSFMLKGGEAHNFQILEQIEVEDDYHGTHNVSMNTKFYPFGGGMLPLRFETNSTRGLPLVGTYTIVNIAYGSFDRVYSKYGRSTGSMILSGIGAKFSMAKMISAIILLVVNIFLLKGYTDHKTYKQARIHKKVLRYLDRISKNPTAAGQVDQNLHDLLISES